MSFTQEYKIQDTSTWINKNGEAFQISEMTTSHILNSIKKSLRDNWRKAARPHLLAELKKRGLDEKYPELFI